MLRKVVASLLGKIGKETKSPFMNEARKIIAEGSEFKRINTPIIEVIVGSSINSEEWLLPNSENKFLVSTFPYRPLNCEVIVRRKFFEFETKDGVFFKVRTNGFFHVIYQLIFDRKKQILHYYDYLVRLISSVLLTSIRLMKFHNIDIEQSILIILRNFQGNRITFESLWSVRAYSFTKTSPEVEFRLNFNPKDDWKEIGKVLIGFYRELCLETGCIDITDSTIKQRLHKILLSMRDLHTEYVGSGIRLARVNINAFGFKEEKK